jgi:hypothetical protein
MYKKALWLPPYAGDYSRSFSITKGLDSTVCSVEDLAQLDPPTTAHMRSGWGSNADRGSLQVPIRTSLTPKISITVSSAYASGTLTCESQLEGKKGQTLNYLSIPSSFGKNARYLGRLVSSQVTQVK